MIDDIDLNHFTVAEVAVLLTVCEETVRRWCRAGKIPCFQAGARGSYHIPTSAVLQAKRQILARWSKT